MGNGSGLGETREKKRGLAVAGDFAPRASGITGFSYSLLLTKMGQRAD